MPWPRPLQGERVMQAEDTIAALATARGLAALAVVRVSGPRALSIVEARFRGGDLQEAASHTAHVGYLLTSGGETIDQVVVTVFHAPRSATGEDVVEISCHGGAFAPQLVLESLFSGGARPAGPGEFTQRAFLNGKLDLAQAEAVADLIHASSTRAHRTSLAHLQGRYSEQLARLRAELLELCAFVELELDFSEEDVAFADRPRLEQLLSSAEALLDALLGSYRTGVLIRDGVRVVIAGRPNAGKSTLLNALVGRDRAIVSETPGTTRDEIESEVELEGLLFRFVDTAGLREATDAIEAEGVRRAREAVATSDVLCYVFDVSSGGLEEDERGFLVDVQAAHPELPVVLVGNKRDLVAEPARVSFDADASIVLSATQARREAAALQPLAEALLHVVAADLRRADASPVVMNQRHRQHLAGALQAVRAARGGLEAGRSGDLLALDLRAALHELGAITGEISNEAVLDQIFSRFCIGK